MSDQPQSWHYGLVARWWAEFNTADPDELAFYQKIIETNGGPALDLACGAGRLLLPLLRAGLDVDGADISPDMLNQCRRLAEREGLTPTLLQGAMHDVPLPRTYGTIFICDSFNIGGDRGHDLATLRRCHQHLAPGGVLVFNAYVSYNPDEWAFWLPERRQALPEPWPDTDLRKRAADGDEIALSSRVIELDPLTQRHTKQIRIRLWRGDNLIQEEEGILAANLYFPQELLLMLDVAGFAGVEVRGDYSDQPAGPDDMMLVYIARK
ncbi:MAG: class I SAM-dependent methyltransferase [Thermomicrobiales bacterium]